MSPVHVIVGEDPRAEAMWSSAFVGAVDLYRFERNIEAFERLTVAEAAIDLVILTPAQRGPFNLTADQFLARVLEGPLGAGRFLANLHVIVVGERISRSHPRVMAVSTLDAAIRLVKFGELERSAHPDAQELPGTAPRSSGSAAAEVDALLADSMFSASVISSIWDAPRASPQRGPESQPPRDGVVGGGPRRHAPREAVSHAATLPATGLAEAMPEPIAPAALQLFSRAAPTGFVVAPIATARASVTEPVAGGGGPAPVGAPGEAIQVATGALQASRPYQLPNGAGYRGPALREGQMHGAMHIDSPVPPALASQVQSLVYGTVGAVPDPLLVWTSSSRGQTALEGTSIPVPTTSPQQVHAPMPAQVRTVPMDPPAGAYGAVPQAAATIVADPFLRRAEHGGGEVSFG